MIFVNEQNCAPIILLRFLDRCPYQVAPFCPRTIIITDTWIAEQTRQDEPGMRGTLTNTAVRDDIFIGCNILPTVDLAQFIRRLEGAIGIGSCGPGNVLSS